MAFIKGMKRQCGTCFEKSGNNTSSCFDKSVIFVKWLSPTVGIGYAFLSFCSLYTDPSMADRSSGSLPESDRVLGHCVTRVTSHSFSFSWEIEDFLSLPPSLGNEVYSSYFSVPEMEGTWFLCLCPRGSEFDPEDTVSVWLYWCGKSKVEVQFTIAFCTDSKGMNVLASETGTYEFGLMENCSGWSAFIGRQDLKDALRSDQAILPLYIHCHLRCFDGVVTDTATTDAVRSIDHEYMHELGQALHADSSGCDVVLLVQVPPL